MCPTGMLFVAIHRHRAEDCPGREPQHIKEMSEMLSRRGLSKKGLKFVDAYIDHACMVQSTGQDHLCTFVLEGETPQAIAEAFEPFPVEVRPIVGWEKYLKKV